MTPPGSPSRTSREGLPSCLSALPLIVQKRRRFDVKGLGHVPERNDSDVLLTPLHRAYMCAINAHPVRQSSLAEAGFFPKKL